MEPSGVFLSDLKEDGIIIAPDGGMWSRYRYFVQRWQPGGSGWTSGPEISVPGHLLRTWRAADGGRLLLAENGEYRRREGPVPGWALDSRLSLMRQENLPSGPTVARLLDSRLLADRLLPSSIGEGERFMVVMRRRALYG